MSLSERIIESNKGLLGEMVQLKYQAMSESAFRFFRGTCDLFYQDLATWKALPKSPLSWICGDLHVENFGSYKSDEGQVYFDLNDFDVVFRLAGTGSVGTKRYMFLLESLQKKGKYLIVDMKQSQPSALNPFVKTKQPAWSCEAERVVFAQELSQHMPCALLSYTIFKGDSYVMKEMQPTEDKIKFRLIQDQYRDIYQVIDDMALLTASAHIRSSGRSGSAIADELIEFGQGTDWQPSLIDYAQEYFKKVKKDYKIFKEGFESGLYEQKTSKKAS